MIKLKSKFLLDIYKQLAELFGDKEHYVPSTEEQQNKMKDKIPLLNREATALLHLIQCNTELIEAIEAEQVTGIEAKRNKRSILLLKKENVDLEFEYYAKMDFVDQYEKRIKYEKEYYESFTKTVKEEIEALAKKLEAILTSVPDGSKEKTLLIGIIYEYYTTKDNVSDMQRNTLFKHMSDMYRRTKQFEIKKQEYEETHITV